MADLHAPRIEGTLAVLKREYGENIDVASDRKFLGFEAY